jgi:S-adenosylmethionine-dependent methyltransferase
MTSDRSFDGLSKRFKNNIYGGRKGTIRLHILWKDLITTIPTIESGGPFKILDAGAGMGQLALRLAKLGHEVVLCDISEEMLEHARENIERECPDGKVRIIHSSIQELQNKLDEQFDIVLCHAVLEWQSEPRVTVKGVSMFVKPEGFLSLMFYNIHSIIYRNLIRGNLRKVKSGNFIGDQNSLTPQNPLTPSQVYQWLEEYHFRILTKAGVRVFYDHIPKQVSEKISIEDILEMEWAHCREEPYLSMGRYIHTVCQAPGP